MKSRTKGLDGRLKKIEEEVEQQQITNRQDNIVFFGVPEEGRESSDDCASTMVTLLNQHDPLRRWKSDDMAREKPIERGAEAVDHAQSWSGLSGAATCDGSSPSERYAKNCTRQTSP